MTINMSDSHVTSIAQVKKLLQVSGIITFKGVSKKEKYAWISEKLTLFKYFSLRKKDKGVIRKYLRLMTGLSKSQLTRLISKKKKTGTILPSTTRRNSFPSVYTPGDIAKLVETDNNHKRLSGPATKKILAREYKLFGKKEYERLSDISVSHIYNLRKKRIYVSSSLTFSKTQSASVNIGERRKPNNEGKPGFIRVDTVHQGDLGKKKGVYHINLVDEVTQWELVICVEKISERYLVPLLEKVLLQFPFAVINFHSDNGSEFINRVIAKLLNKLLVSQTKSRSRHCNDQALVEGKNTIIRKHFGRNYINQKNARIINKFYQEYFNVYLNYHRPCGFATETVDRRGKIRKKYDQYLMPYEKFLSLENPQQYLREGVSLDSIRQLAKQKSDNEFAALMSREKDRLFNNFKK